MWGCGDVGRCEVAESTEENGQSVSDIDRLIQQLQAERAKAVAEAAKREAERPRTLDDASAALEAYQRAEERDSVHPQDVRAQVAALAEAVRAHHQHIRSVTPAAASSTKTEAN